MDIKLYQVDAFTDRVFGGNPAAVCPLDTWLPDDVMQSIALENNLSETAFFLPRAEGGKGGEYDIRWFSPVLEIDLAGHPTLATAHIIFSRLVPDLDVAVFHTKLGDTLSVVREGDRLAMDFPSRYPTTNPLAANGARAQRR